jgi:hypothetical protein
MLTMTMSCLVAAGPVETDYATAYAAAREQSKMLVVNVGTSMDLSSFSESRSEDFVFCQLSADATITSNGNLVRLVSHPAFADLDGSGIAVIDLQHPAFLGQVVSVLPQRHVTFSNVQALLDLPEGSLTQRTLVWALRVHPERPMSVFANPAPELMAHARNHSSVQARTNHQHHNLPVGIASSEIVAESWPWNHNVVDAAVDIVGSWRQSSGHWGAARKSWSHFGYDMKTNGRKWFATGVFR